MASKVLTRMGAAVAASALIAVGLVAIHDGPAASFGTIEGLGQHREHEMITRTLSCDSEDGPRKCFGEHTLDLLAGKRGTFGGVGAPDNPAMGLGPAEKHCDDADYGLDADSGYPQTKSQAHQNLRNCINVYDRLLDQAVSAAGRLIDSSGQLKAREADIYNGTPGLIRDDCAFPKSPDRDQPAKCEVLNGLGRALHVSEDFWSHSNWGDQANSGARTIANPTGLNRTDMPSFFKYPVPKDYVIPDGLVTGCDDSLPFSGCSSRISHSMLAKDKGLIDWRTGAASAPSMPRSLVGTNFQKAVTGARAQARFTWSELADHIRAKYRDESATILDAIVDDSPWTGCKRISGDAKAAMDPPRRSTPSGARTVDITVRNESQDELRCSELSLDYGQWGEYPKTSIADGKRGSWKVQGASRATGTEGRAEYAIGATGRSVTIKWNSQVWGSDSYRCLEPNGYLCSVDQGGTSRERTLTILLRKR